MSVLETPRVLFRGKIAWDPIVTNNYANLYDESTSLPVYDGGKSADAFRARAIAGVTTIGNWNPDGTHRSTFYETLISGVDMGAGATRQDAFVGSPVGLGGMLVDLEPYGAYTSQLFFDVMSLGIEGGCRIFAPRSARMTARYINFGRNLSYGGPPAAPAGSASVVWQTSFAKTDGLAIDAYDSVTLQALKAALEDDDVLGLTVRWNAYRTVYYDLLDTSKVAQAAAALQKNLEGGGWQPNPARSEVVGVVGLWRRGEPCHEPGDRALLQTPAATVGSASARLTKNRLTLDLANSIAETGADLVKQDLGELSVVAVEDGEVAVTLGAFGYAAYDREAYDRTGGIVALDVAPADAERAAGLDLQLRQADGTVLLTETALRAIPMEPNIYLNEGDSGSAGVLVLDRGVPAGAGVEVTMVNSPATTPVGVVRPTNADGVARFPLYGVQGQVEAFILLPGRDSQVPNTIDTQQTTYLYVRTLPADSATAALQPTWDNVYAQVLRNWDAMAPCMDNWLRFRDEEQVKAFAPMLKKLTDPANFEMFRFMPVTRDMTQGQRTLLYNFLNANAPTGSLKAAAKSPPPSLAALSRSHRGG